MNHANATYSPAPDKSYNWATIGCKPDDDRIEGQTAEIQVAERQVYGEGYRSGIIMRAILITLNTKHERSYRPGYKLLLFSN